MTRRESDYGLFVLLGCLTGYQVTYKIRPIEDRLVDTDRTLELNGIPWLCTFEE